MRHLLRALPILILAAAAVPAAADTYGTPWRSNIPVSALARPAAWLDPSRLKVSTELMVGTGFGGPTQGLSVTRFQYQLGQPLAMRVSLGNAFGSSPGRDGSFFLEGLDLSYQPFGSFQIQVHYQDVRSPLQYGRYGYSPFSR